MPRSKRTGPGRRGLPLDFPAHAYMRGLYAAAADEDYSYSSDESSGFLGFNGLGLGLEVGRRN